MSKNDGIQASGGTTEKWRSIVKLVRDFVSRSFGNDYADDVRHTQTRDKITFVVDMHDRKLNLELMRKLGYMNIPDAVTNPALCDGVAVFEIKEKDREPSEQKLQEAVAVRERIARIPESRGPGR